MQNYITCYDIKAMYSYLVFIAYTLFRPCRYCFHFTCRLCFILYLCRPCKFTWTIFTCHDVISYSGHADWHHSHYIIRPCRFTSIMQAMQSSNVITCLGYADLQQHICSCRPYWCYSLPRMCRFALLTLHMHTM